MFLYLLPVEEQTDIASWFYSYREFYKFGLSYLIIRPFDKVTDQTEFGNRMNELPYHSRYMYYEIFDGQVEELQWLYLALCEEVESRKKTFPQKPAGTNFEKIFQKAEEICKRLEMTAEEFVNERFIPKEAEKRRRENAKKYCVQSGDDIYTEDGRFSIADSNVTYRSQIKAFVYTE